MATTFTVKVFVVLDGWESEATTVIVAVPLLCKLGIIESSRLVPAPLKVRCELLNKLVFDDLAVVVTVKIASALSVTPTGRLVESSSPIVMLVGRVNTGAAARAIQPLIASTISTATRCSSFLLDAKKFSAQVCCFPGKDIDFITIEFTTSKRHDLLDSFHGSSLIGVSFPSLSTNSHPQD